MEQRPVPDDERTVASEEAVAAALAAVAFERLATENEHPSAQTKAMRDAAGVQK